MDLRCSTMEQRRYTWSRLMFDNRILEIAIGTCNEEGCGDAAVIAATHTSGIRDIGEEIAASVVATAVSSVVFFFAWTYLTSPVKNIPGPFLAKCTNWWRLYGIYNNTSVETQRQLHKKYGSAVQLGPNLVSLTDPDLVQTLYDTRGNYLKSHFYDNNSSKVGKEIVYNVFSTRDNKFHAHALRPIRKFFALSSVLKTEPLVDETIQLLLSQLDATFTGSKAEETCPMDKWLPFFTWDVMANLTLGTPMGYLKHGCDFDSMQHTGDETFFYFAVVGQIPQLDYCLVKNPILRIGPPAFDGPAAMCAQRIAQRQAEFEANGEATHKDMLEDFMRINREDKDMMDDNAVVVALMVNILAGGDTTGVLCCAIMYYVLKNPGVYRRLMEELDAAELVCPVSYAKAEKLRYFDAVVKEAGRMHPGVGLILERVVPAEGLVLRDGRALKPGTVVGMNAWVVHQNKEIFGEDAAVFNPDRWLKGKGETEEAYQARYSSMKNHDLSFGIKAGKRVCMGRAVSILETYKVMTTLFLTYEMSLVDPKKEWFILYSWFTKQSGIDVRLKKREQISI